MWPNLQFSTDFVTFAEEILNGKLHFLVQFEQVKIFRENFCKKLSVC